MWETVAARIDASPNIPLVAIRAHAEQLDREAARSRTRNWRRLVQAEVLRLVTWLTTIEAEFAGG
jgi:LmbE family N-acetylglucosaminyl deacetylase